MIDNLERLKSRDEYLSQWAVGEIEAIRQREKALESMVQHWQSKYERERDLYDRQSNELATLKAGQGEPVAWIRFCSDGCYEGPIMNSKMEDVRKASGAWTPLYPAAAPKHTKDGQ